jgi:NAD(P)-dependent dehydrogenase (short-subunit alcohol dehydrogenase family)
MKRIMNGQNFTTTFTVDQSPAEAFAAINNVRGWWSGEIEGSTDKLGDEFTYRYKDLHYSKQKLTELIPGKKVVWRVLDSSLNFIEDRTEWKGTEITFEISKKGNKTEIRFTHVGLVPEHECYDACSDAWGSYINGSLRSLITKGKGQPNKMEKKVILITGTNSGFGWLTANSCAALGHKVYATMRDTKGRNADKAKALVQQANIEVLDVEVTNGKSVADAVATIIKKEGRIDVVVNNAGIYATGIAETFTEDDVDKIMDVDVKGPWRIIRAALPQMRKQGEGLIINISSVAGRFSFPFQTVYNGAKFAVEGLTEGLHYEVRPLGVDVVMIQPGAFPTDVWGKTITGSDATVIAGYGDLAKVPEQIGAGIGKMFETLKPNPQLVADAIVKLINTPNGKRPLRTVVDPATGNFSEIANKHVKEQYENFLTAFGMQAMLS